MLIIILLNVAMPSVIKPSVILLSVVAPFKGFADKLNRGSLGGRNIFIFSSHQRNPLQNFYRSNLPFGLVS
jgi:hypothetical protein